MNTFGNLGGAISPLVVGYAVQWWNSWSTALIVTAGVYVLGGLLTLAINPTKRLLKISIVSATALVLANCSPINPGKVAGKIRFSNTAVPSVSQFLVNHAVDADPGQSVKLHETNGTPAIAWSPDFVRALGGENGRRTDCIPANTATVAD